MTLCEFTIAYLNFSTQIYLRKLEEKNKCLTDLIFSGSLFLTGTLRWGSDGSGKGKPQKPHTDSSGVSAK
jgi:hypothetical protein